MKHWAPLTLALLSSGCAEPQSTEEKIYTQGALGSVSISPRMAESRGVWAFDGPEKIAAKHNISRIECLAATGRCTDYRAELYPIGNDAFNFSISEDTYSVTSWTEDEVVAVAQGDCRKTTIRLQVKPKRGTTGVQENGSDVANCIFDPLSGPRVMRLIDSTEQRMLYWPLDTD